MATALRKEEEERIKEKFGDVKNHYDAFLLARILLIAEYRQNGMGDASIAREVAVNFTDNGAHIRKLRSAYDVA